MAEWGFWEWLAYFLIAIAATMPALGAAFSAEKRLATPTASLVENRWWKIIPAAALFASGALIAANQMGWTTPRRQDPPKVVTKIVLDPSQTTKINALQAQVKDLKLSLWYARKHGHRQIQSQPQLSANPTVSSYVGSSLDTVLTCPLGQTSTIDGSCKDIPKCEENEYYSSLLSKCVGLLPLQGSPFINQ